MRLWFVVVVILWSALASADTIYKYRDRDSGRDVFVNRLDRIPPEYRSHATIVVESPAKASKQDHDPTPAAEPPPRSANPTAVDQARSVGTDLRRAMVGKNLWKDGAAIACATIDAKLTREGAPPLSMPERDRFAKFLTNTLVLSTVACLVAFAVWIVMFVSAIRERHFWWAALMFFCWPLAYFYLFLHAGNGRTAFKLACAAGMLFPALVGVAGAWRFHAWFQAVVEARGGHL